MDAGRSKEEQAADAERVKDTNVEGIGSQENRDQRKAAAETEEAWKGAGEKAGKQIWRIEKMKVKRWDEKRYGTFFSGDSYIVLNTKVDESGKKSYDVHFWLGKDTSQDEMGVAAYKTVELDDLLGDEPVQYREVQGNESRMFTDMFDKITILNGGVASGFNIVKSEEYKPRLLHLEGYHEKVQCFQVPMDVKSLNNKDSFVLDCGLKLYQFNGVKANAWEKRKANDKVNEIRDARQGKVETHITVDGLDDDQKEAGDFWAHLGGKPEKIIDGDEGPAKETPPRIVRISDEASGEADGKIKMDVMCEGELDASKLDSADAFIVDTGVSLYIWIGKNANKAEKKEAMPHAVKYLKQNDRDPMSVPICRVAEGREPEHFSSILGVKGKWDANVIKKGGFAGRKSCGAVLRDMRADK